MILVSWRKIQACIARISHLDTLRFVLGVYVETHIMMRIARPVLEAIRASGKNMAFQVKGEETWRSLSDVLERFEYVLSHALLLTKPEFSSSDPLRLQRRRRKKMRLLRPI